MILIWFIYAHIFFETRVVQKTTKQKKVDDSYFLSDEREVPWVLTEVVGPDFFFSSKKSKELELNHLP